MDDGAGAAGDQPRRVQLRKHHRRQPRRLRREEDGPLLRLPPPRGDAQPRERNGGHAGTTELIYRKQKSKFLTYLIFLSILKVLNTVK